MKLVEFIFIVIFFVGFMAGIFEKDGLSIFCAVIYTGHFIEAALLKKRK